MAALTRSLRPLTSTVSAARSALLCASSSSSSCCRAFSAPSALRLLSARGAAIGRVAVPRNSELAVTSARFSSALAASRPSESEVRARLVNLLEREVAHEVDESKNPDPVNENDLNTFLETTDWKLNNTIGHDEVVLSKSFGKENISVTFCLSDVNQDDSNEDEDQEPEEEMDNPLVSVNAMVNCEKPGHGVLTFDVTFEDGVTVIQSVAYYPTAQIAKLEDAESEWKRRGLYGGPVFSQLEDDLQEAFHEYLVERGFDDNLSHFVVNYVHFGEQKEYLNWLRRVKDHVKA